MADDLEARLAAAAEAVREQEITAQRCEDLWHRIDQLNGPLAALQAEHAAELDDVERLEGISLTRLLAGVRGNREDRLSREKAEAYAAALRVQDAQSRLAALHHEHEAARARWHQLADAPAAYAAVLDEKERYLHESDDPRAPRILDLADDRGRLMGELNEVGEAQMAVVSAVQSLAEVQDRLGSASGWSTYDTWLGGGMLSSAMKHDRLDDAAEAARRADRCLVVLRTELADVGGAGVHAPELAFDGLTRFLDVWFDNIFTDWAVADRIKDAQRNVVSCFQAVDHVRARLEARAAELQDGLERIETERRNLLTQR